MGRDNTERLAGMSEFPWICANLIEKETGELVDWVQPTLMLDLPGHQDRRGGHHHPGTVAMSFPENIAGLEFLPMPETVAKYRDKLQGRRGRHDLPGHPRGTALRPEGGLEEDRRRHRDRDRRRSRQGTYGSNYSYGGMNLMELVNKVPGIDFAVGGHTHRGYHEPWIDPDEPHHVLRDPTATAPASATPSC